MGGGPDDGFVDFVQATQHRLLRAAYLVCGDHHLAQDLLQDAYIKTASRWPSLRDGAPEAYIRRILYRDAVSRWRKWGREKPTDSHDVHQVGPALGLARHRDAASDWVNGAEVRAALLQLSPRQRAVIVLRYYEDRSEAEIAELLGIRPGTVKSQASRALEHLRCLLPELAPAFAGEGSERA